MQVFCFQAAPPCIGTLFNRLGLFPLLYLLLMATNITDDSRKPDAQETDRIHKKGNYDQGNTGRYDNQQFDADNDTPRAGEDLPMAGGGYGQGMNTPGYDEDPEATDHVNAATGGALSADGEAFNAGDATEASSDPNASTGSTTSSGHGTGHTSGNG
jgi:hypothetical protein